MYNVDVSENRYFFSRRVQSPNVCQANITVYITTVLIKFRLKMGGNGFVLHGIFATSVQIIFNVRLIELVI